MRFRDISAADVWNYVWKWTDLLPVATLLALGIILVSVAPARGGEKIVAGQGKPVARDGGPVDLTGEASASPTNEMAGGQCPSGAEPCAVGTANGVFTISALLVPCLNVAFSELDFEDDGTTLTVTGVPAVMTGDGNLGPNDAFSVVGNTGGTGPCGDQTWRLSGQFDERMNRWGSGLLVVQIPMNVPDCPCLSGTILEFFIPEAHRDCDHNFVPDECDIADCAGDLECQDCNNNCIPDGCETVDPAAAIVWVGGAGVWSDPANWCPQVVPDNGGGQTFDVEIFGGSSQVTLDISPTVNTVALSDSAILGVNNGSGGDQTLRVTQTPGITNSSLIQAADGRVLTLIANVQQVPPGTLNADGAGSEVRIAGGSLVSDGVLRAASDGVIVIDASTATSVALVNQGGNIQVTGGGALVDPTVEILEVPDGESGFLEGVVDTGQGGLISVNAESALTSLLTTGDSAVVTLEGSGTLWLSENASNGESHAAFGSVPIALVTATGFHITGTGRIDASTITNAGSITAEGIGADDRGLSLLAFDITNTGVIAVEDGGSLLTLGDVVSVGGTVLVDGNALIDMLFGTLTLTQGAVYEAVLPDSASARLFADGVTIEGHSGARMTLSDDMTAVINGQLMLTGGPCPPLLGGCTPPSFVMRGQSIFDGINMTVDGGGASEESRPLVDLADETILDLTSELLIQGGGVFQGGGASLTAGQLSVLGTPGGGPVTEMILEGMSATIAGDIFMETGCKGASVGGCTPPVTRMSGAQLMGGGNMLIAGSDPTAGSGPSVQMDGSAAIELMGSLTIGNGGTLEGMKMAMGSVSAPDGVAIGPCGATFSVAGSITVTTGEDGNFIVEGPPPLPGLLTGGCTPPGLLPGGCTPPNVIAGSGSVFVVGGTLSMVDFVQITVDPGGLFILGGDFDNRIALPDCFLWGSGSLMMNGPGDEQLFEVAGEDRGPLPIGFENNFAMGTVEVSAGSRVTFLNAFPEGQPPCSQALYVSELILRAGSTVRLEDCRVYYATIVDEGAILDPVGCGELVQICVGDHDGDCDVDLEDYEEFRQCVTGPDGGPVDEGCAMFDFDSDDDVDLTDLGRFQLAFTGPSAH